MKGGLVVGLRCGGRGEGRFVCEVRGEVWYHRRNWLVLGLKTTSGRKTVPDDGGCVACDV